MASNHEPHQDNKDDEEPEPEEAGQSSLLPDKEVFKIELMYTSRTSKAFVCACLANLYQKHKSCNPASDSKEWFLVATGIPVIVAELMETKNGGPPTCALQMRIAENGTGFTLWVESLDHDSRYVDTEPGFHTLEINKSDCNLTVGLSFDSPVAARNFYHRLKFWQDEFRNNAELHRGEKKSFLKRSMTIEWPAAIAGLITRQRNPVEKSSISGPCFFRHVTALRPSDIVQNTRSFEKITTLPSSFKSQAPANHNTHYSFSLRRNGAMDELKEGS